MRVKQHLLGGISATILATASIVGATAGAAHASPSCQEMEQAKDRAFYNYHEFKRLETQALDRRDFTTANYYSNLSQTWYFVWYKIQPC